MNDIWVKLYRKIWKNPISRKPDYLAVWLYLFTHACHRSKNAQLGNRVIKLKKGMMVTSMRRISRFFDIPVSKVKYILDYLRDERMIDIETTESYSVITVLKFDEYQKGDIDNPSEKIHYADNVVMTNRQYGFLAAKHGNQILNKAIDYLSGYKIRNDRTFKSDFHAMNSWVINKVKKMEDSNGHKGNIKPDADGRVLESWLKRKKV